MRILVSGSSGYIGAVAAIVGDAVPGASLQVPESAVPDTRSYQVVFSIVEDKRSGYTPEWTVRGGVDEVVEGCIGANMSEPDSPLYTRLATIEKEIDQGRVAADLQWP